MVRYYPLAVKALIMETLESFYGTEVAARMQTPLPDGYFSYRSCRAFFLREAGTLGDMVPTGTEECAGARWHHGPFHFEKFVGDAVPQHDPTGPLRLCIWQPVTRTDRPAGWYRGTQGMSLRMTGFAKVEALENGEWSPHAKRHLAKFKKLVASGEREIEETSLKEYLAAYAKADQDRTMKAFFPYILREKARMHGNRFHLLVSRRKNGPIDAGLAYVHIPEAHQSNHVSAFMSGKGKTDSASTGLVARWFDECREQQVPYLDFGCFWAPRDPRDWKGFSRFKAQFGVRLIKYPTPMVRWFGRPFWKK